MSEKKYVPEGVYLACDKGTCPSQLRVSQKSTDIYGVPVATEADKLPFLNIKPMGFCSATWRPCLPSVPKWDNVQEGVTVNGFRLLKEDSTCQCTVGGKINIHFTHQAASGVALWGGVKMPTEYIKDGFDWMFEQADTQREMRDELLRDLGAPEWMVSVTHGYDWTADLSVGLVEGAVSGVVGLGETVYQVGQDPVGTAEAIGGMAKSGWNSFTGGISSAWSWGSEGENWTNAAEASWDWASDGDNWVEAGQAAWEGTVNTVEDTAHWVADNPRTIGTSVGEFIPDAAAAYFTGGTSLAASGARVAGREIVEEVVEETVERAVREGLEEAGEEAAERAAREAGEEVAEQAVKDTVDELPEVVVRQADDMTPGSPAHKATRWEEYQERGGEWDYDRWSKTYENNMTRATKAHKATDEFHETLGWGEREVTVDVNGQARRLDIADVADRRGLEYKSGSYFSRTEDIMSEIARDTELVKQGWDIDWVIDGTASQPLIDELKNAGINVILNP